MPKGSWSLVYQSINWMKAGMFRSGAEEKSVLLAATTESEAILEARAKWSDILAAMTIEWEKQNTTSHNCVFGVTAPNPQVVYRIPLT